MAKIIGIDLGTSNSAAAFLEAGRPKIIPSAEGASQYGKAFPSVVAFTKDGQMLVGIVQYIINGAGKGEDIFAIERGNKSSVKLINQDPADFIGLFFFHAQFASGFCVGVLHILHQ